jgi:YfiH family protein
MLSLGPLNRLDGVRHAFFTREGGVSNGVFTSLNCGLGSGDTIENVQTNRARCAERLDVAPDQLLTLYQVHSADAVTIDEPFHGDARPRADAMVTNRPGIALGVLAADCAPVLLADAKARVIGAAHAGWKGALGGVAASTVKAMVALGADPANIVAGIGPCIAQRSYEVGPEFPLHFTQKNAEYDIFFAPFRNRDGAAKFLFDLRGFVGATLADVGVKQVYDLPHDTCREDRFFSYRRTCLRGEKDYGRGLSAIALEP